MRSWVLLVMPVILLAGILVGGCQVEEDPQHLNMRWGIPEEVTGFEGLEREPQGEEVTKINQDQLEVVWRPGESYILPISSTANKELEAVRYYGENIPSTLEVDWLDPHERQWYPLEEIPQEKIHAEIEQENQLLTIDFGPPQGANFEEDMTRVIWFRLTPQKIEEWEMEIHGYLWEEESPDRQQISNPIKLEAEVTENE